MASSSVTEHIRLMESRIEQQTAAIERLKRSAQDTSEAVRRLKLLERALEEIRIQLGQLSPTALDGRRSRLNGRNGAPARKK